MAADPDLVEFGKTVRRLRGERGLSQEELADLCGLHRNYIGGIERGERNVGLKAVFSLARGLGVRSRELFGMETVSVEPETE
jgi:transcriptional regulator with XRE-family HTH domain